MKRILSAFLLLLFIALICGCADNALNASNADTSESVSAESVGGESKDSEGLEASSESITESAGEPSDESFSGSVSEPDGDESEETSLPPESIGGEASEKPDESEYSQPEEESFEESSEAPSEAPDESVDESVPEQPDESEDEPVNDIGDAEFIGSNYLIYNGAAYYRIHYSESSAKRYADMYATYKQTFPEVGIHVISHPASAIGIPNPAVLAMVNDQGEVLDLNASHIYGGVNYVNLRETFETHRGEYLFFKSDYHWTQLGAYYAYCEFAKSIGLTPTPLNDFESVIVTEKFVGHTSDYAHDPRIDTFLDTITAYMPRKEHTMAVYLSDSSLYRVFKNCIQTSVKSYSCFLTGDQAYIEINVPENDQEKTVLVIKESSGNAFVPFLTEHYGNILVIDPRHIMLDIKKLVAEKGVDDIILFATASTCNGQAYCNYYGKLIGK